MNLIRVAVFFVVLASSFDFFLFFVAFGFPVRNDFWV